MFDIYPECEELDEDVPELDKIKMILEQHEYPYLITGGRAVVTFEEIGPDGSLETVSESHDNALQLLAAMGY